MNGSRRTSAEDLELQFALIESLLMEEDSAAEPNLSKPGKPVAIGNKLVALADRGTPALVAAVEAAIKDKDAAVVARLERGLSSAATKNPGKFETGAIDRVRALLTAAKSAPAAPAAPAAAATPAAALAAVAAPPAAPAAAPPAPKLVTAPAPSPAGGAAPPAPGAAGAKKAKQPTATADEIAGGPAAPKAEPAPDLAPGREGEDARQSLRKSAAALEVPPETPPLELRPEPPAAPLIVPAAPPLAPPPPAPPAPKPEPVLDLVPVSDAKARGRGSKGVAAIEPASKYAAWVDALMTAKDDAKDEMIAKLIKGTPVEELKSYVGALGDPGNPNSMRAGMAKAAIQDVIDKGKPLPVADAPAPDAEKLAKAVDEPAKEAAKGGSSVPAKATEKSPEAPGLKSPQGSEAPDEATPEPESVTGKAPGPDKNSHAARVANALSTALGTVPNNSGGAAWTVGKQRFGGGQLTGTVRPFGKKAATVSLTLDLHQILQSPDTANRFLARLSNAMTQAADTTITRVGVTAESRQRRRSAEELEEGLWGAAKSAAHAIVGGRVSNTAGAVARFAGGGAAQQKTLNAFANALGTPGDATSHLYGTTASIKEPLSIGAKGQGELSDTTLKALSGGRQEFKTKLALTFTGVGERDQKAIDAIWNAIQLVTKAARA